MRYFEDIYGHYPYLKQRFVDWILSPPSSETYSGDGDKLSLLDPTE
jgi:hypothetical protein